MTGVVEQMGAGNTAVSVPGTSRGDELGIMAKTIEFFRQKLIEIDEVRHKTEAGRAGSQLLRAAAACWTGWRGSSQSVMGVR